MPRLPVLAALAVIWSAAPALADFPSPAETDLMRRADELNELCRGGAGDSDETMRACDRRGDAFNRANAAGFCYGRRDQAGYQHRWHYCNALSNASPFPMPDLPIEERCRAQFTRNGRFNGHGYNVCVLNETDALYALAPYWPRIPERARDACATAVDIQGWLYQALHTCLGRHAFIPR